MTIGGMGLPSSRKRILQDQKSAISVVPKWPVKARRTCKLPSNSLCFIETEDLDVGKTLVEPAKTKYTLCRALPAVYQKTTKVAMLNLGPKITVKAGTTIAEATPMVLKVQPQTKETINTIQNDDAKQLWEDL